MPVSEVFNMDCVEGMKQYPDKFFDLAIVDPPYGIGEGSKKIHTRHHSQKKYTPKDWDAKAPNEDYFTELKRVSKNQIVWGANHFISRIPYDSSCWVFWDKDTGDCDFADGELAWTSFKTAVKVFRFTWNGFRQGYTNYKEERFHPTQKPVALYKWLLLNYAKKGDRILDTHLGSGSHRIAAYHLGFDFTGFEMDQEYYEKQDRRFKDAIAQPLFEQPKPATQVNFFDALDNAV